MPKINWGTVVPSEQMKGDSPEDTELLKELLDEATDFLSAFRWCTGIKKSFFGFGVGAIFGVFLFEISSNVNDVDGLVWVVVGDLPQLYIAVDEAPNPACALDIYLNAMLDWCETAKSGGDLSKCPPVDADPDPENIFALLGRLEFLRNEILVHYTELLI